MAKKLKNKNQSELEKNEKRLNFADFLQRTWDEIDQTSVHLTGDEFLILQKISKAINKLCLKIRGIKNNIEL